MNNAFFRFDDFESSPISLQWIVQDDQPIHSRNISSRARGTRSTLAKEREKKKESSRDVVSSSQFLELIDSSSNTESSLPDKGQSSEFYSFAAFPSRSLHTLLFFPRKQPILTDPRFHHYFPSRFLIIVLFLREIESSPISSQLRQLLIYPTGNRSFCRNGFHPASIFVSFRLIDLSLRIFVSPVRCRSPGREAGGGKERALGTHRQTVDPFSLPVAFHPVVTRSLTGGVILYGEIRVHSNFSGL